jgi:hypothetical protein
MSKSRREKTLELFHIIGLDNVVRVSGIENTIDSYRIAAGDKALEEGVANALKKLHDILHEHVGELLVNFAEIYEKAYTEDQIDAMIDFNHSDLGRVLNERGAAVVGAINKLATDWQNYIIGGLDEDTKLALGAKVPTE